MTRTRRSFILWRLTRATRHENFLFHGNWTHRDVLYNAYDCVIKKKFYSTAIDARDTSQICFILWRLTRATHHENFLLYRNWRIEAAAIASQRFLILWRAIAWRKFPILWIVGSISRFYEDRGVMFSKNVWKSFLQVSKLFFWRIISLIH